jgi:RNA polymerase sigma-70 factor (ECF subfamily)
MIGAMADELGARVESAVNLGDFASWMASEQRRIFLLCRRLLQDPEEADSATQDVFLKAYKALQKRQTAADDIGSPDKWVTRIAVNTCLDRLRSKTWKMWQRRPKAEDETVILEMTAGREPDPERQLFSRQIQQRLEAALLRLSARQRAVFSLRHYEGLPLEEIASLLKLDLGTVKAHLFRATQKLKEELKDLYLSHEAKVRRTV